MGLDDDRPAGVVGSGAVEERKEGLARGAAGAQRCIALSLVDDKYVTGRWGAEVGKRWLGLFEQFWCVS
jgi:hypothetical protein